QGVLHTMLLRKLKLMALGLLAFLVCSWGLLATVQANAQVHKNLQTGPTKVSYAGATASGQAKDDAQKLYEAMEEKLAKAQAYKSTCTIEAHPFVPGAGKIKATFVIAAGNRTNMTLDYEVDGHPVKTILISDCKTLFYLTEKGDDLAFSQRR